MVLVVRKELSLHVAAVAAGRPVQGLAEIFPGTHVTVLKAGLFRFVGKLLVEVAHAHLVAADGIVLAGELLVLVHLLVVLVDREITPAAPQGCFES